MKSLISSGRGWLIRVLRIINAACLEMIKQISHRLQIGNRSEEIEIYATSCMHHWIIASVFGISENMHDM